MNLVLTAPAIPSANFKSEIANRKSKKESWMEVPRPLRVGKSLRKAYRAWTVASFRVLSQPFEQTFKHDRHVGVLLVVCLVPLLQPVGGVEAGQPKILLLEAAIGVPVFVETVSLPPTNVLINPDAGIAHDGDGGGVSRDKLHVHYGIEAQSKGSNIVSEPAAAGVGLAPLGQPVLKVGEQVADQKAGAKGQNAAAEFHDDLVHFFWLLLFIVGAILGFHLGLLTIDLFEMWWQDIISKFFSPDNRKK
jgi:hypothetical protein